MSFKKDNYMILNGEHSWDDLCNQLRNQQACNSYNHIYIMGGLYFIRVLMMLNQKIPIQQVCGFLRSSYWWKLGNTKINE